MPEPATLHDTLTAAVEGRIGWDVAAWTLTDPAAGQLHALVHIGQTLDRIAGALERLAPAGD